MYNNMKSCMCVQQGARDLRVGVLILTRFLLWAARNGSFDIIIYLYGHIIDKMHIYTNDITRDWILYRGNKLYSRRSSISSMLICMLC